MNDFGKKTGIAKRGTKVNVPHANRYMEAEHTCNLLTHVMHKIVLRYSTIVWFTAPPGITVSIVELLQVD